MIKAIGFILLGGIAGYTIGFLSNQPQKQQSHSIATTQACDLKVLQKTVSNLSDTKQKFANLFSKYEMLATNIRGNNETLKQLRTEISTRINKLESHLQLSQVTPNISPTTESIQHQLETHSEKDTKLSEQIDPSGLQDAIADMNSSDFATRQRALRALMLIGSSEIKQQIGQLILNEEEDISLRRDIVQNLDWHGLSGELIQLFENSKDYNIRAAAILAAQNSRLDEMEQQYFEETLLKNFTEESDDFIRISTLDYFANKHPDKLQEFFNTQSEEEILSPEVRKHLQFLLVPAPEAPPYEIQDPG